MYIYMYVCMYIYILYIYIYILYLYLHFYRECMSETKLPKHVQNSRDHGISNNLLWEIYKKASPYQCGSKRCDLCLPEKISIICSISGTLLNKITELIFKYRYRNKFLLAKFKKQF